MVASQSGTKNFKLTLEYDGTDFHGWQKQSGVRTVQGVVEGAIADLLGEPVTVNGCCRTDAGVHAWGWVGNFQAATGLEAQSVSGALGARLPDDVVLKCLEDAHAEFHARHDCIARRYLYQITSDPAAILRRVLSYTKFRLDASRMAEAAEALVGEHDFTSFTPAAVVGKVHPVCNVLETSINRDGSVIAFDIKADRFLHHMVRNIVGTLIEIGRGRMGPEQIGAVLRKKDRRAAGPTAPACGLALMEAYYPNRRPTG
jgi:tRNA pseudouridine38-40 synthase